MNDSKTIKALKQIRAVATRALQDVDENMSRSPIAIRAMAAGRLRTILELAESELILNDALEEGRKP